MMPSCRSVRENLTAWVDGELSPRSAMRVQRHLAACSVCAAEADEMRTAIEWQRRCLPQAVMVAEFDPQPLQARLRRALAAEPEPRPMWWARLFQPVAVAGAVVAAAVALIVLMAGGPRAVLIPLGVQSPPPAVARETDLFKDYQLIQRLDALENFDTVESVPLDDDQAPYRG